jgi:hypothetical protein
MRALPRPERTYRRTSLGDGAIRAVLINHADKEDSDGTRT